ncbi:MAG: hypothetical protein R2882_14330 [Gemmatimonadales bacterium]
MTDDRSWQEAMRRLGTEAVVPPGLEARVRRSVRRRHYGALAAAAVVLLLIGGVAGRLTTPRPVRDPRPRFLLLLYENERFNPAGVPHDRLVEEYPLGPPRWLGSGCW